jgi:serine/threonine protein kinase
MPFAYLIDFGIARLISSASMSASGTVGTVSYMARSGSPDHRATAAPMCTRWPACCSSA